MCNDPDPVTGVFYTYEPPSIKAVLSVPSNSLRPIRNRKMPDDQVLGALKLHLAPRIQMPSPGAVCPAMVVPAVRLALSWGDQVNHSGSFENTVRGSLGYCLSAPSENYPECYPERRPELVTATTSLPRWHTCHSLRPWEKQEARLQTREYSKTNQPRQ